MWTAKKPVLPGSPRGPREPCAPTGVAGPKPATPTTRLSIRTRVPTLKHPSGVSSISPGRTAAAPLGLQRHSPAAHFCCFPGLSAWTPGVQAVCQAVGYVRVVPSIRAVRPNLGGRSQPRAHGPPKNPFRAALACQKRTFARFAGLPVSNQSVHRGRHSATLKQVIALLRALLKKKQIYKLMMCAMSL